VTVPCDAPSSPLADGGCLRCAGWLVHASHHEDGGVLASGPVGDARVSRPEGGARGDHPQAGDAPEHRRGDGGPEARHGTGLATRRQAASFYPPVGRRGGAGHRRPGVGGRRACVNCHRGHRDRGLVEAAASLASSHDDEEVLALASALLSGEPGSGCAGGDHANRQSRPNRCPSPSCRRMRYHQTRTTRPRAFAGAAP
jgi:hypothetical protein